MAGLVLAELKDSEQETFYHYIQSRVIFQDSAMDDERVTAISNLSDTTKRNAERRIVVERRKTGFLHTTKY